MADTNAKSNLHFKLITPVSTVFEEEVTEVTVPTTAGEITVLPHHTLLVSTVQPGELILRTGTGKDMQEKAVAIAGGVVEMHDNTLVVLADSAELPTDIDLEAAEQKAAQLAQEISQKSDMDLKSYNTMLRQLQHEQAKLNVGKKWRKL